MPTFNIAARMRGCAIEGYEIDASTWEEARTSAVEQLGEGYTVVVDTQPIQHEGEANDEEDQTA